VRERVFETNLPISFLPLGFFYLFFLLFLENLFMCKRDFSCDDLFVFLSGRVQIRPSSFCFHGHYEGTRTERILIKWWLITDIKHISQMWWLFMLWPSFHKLPYSHKSWKFFIVFKKIVQRYHLQVKASKTCNKISVNPTTFYSQSNLFCKIR